jgi:hypothetical protein
MGLVAALSFEVTSRASFISPCLHLGDAGLMFGPQRLLEYLDVRVNAHGQPPSRSSSLPSSYRLSSILAR